VRDDDAVARVVQISDTHLGAAEGRPPLWDGLVAWMTASPPDLLVHTGDAVLLDPDDDVDRALAKALVDELVARTGVPLVVIPGNHDVGFFDEPAALRDRVAAFRRTWDADTFAVDLAGWRLVGVDVYRLGEGDHDDWLRHAVGVDGPVAVFIHQPLRGDPVDGWEVPAAVARAFDDCVAGADVRVVASGHRHCAATVDGPAHRAVWAPSTRFVGDPGDPPPGAEGVDPHLGVLEHTFHEDGHHVHRVLRPWECLPS
jgi:hypothetical protein